MKLIDSSMEIRQLTFLRFLAASGVVFFHFGRHIDSLAWGNFLWERTNTAVSFFFVLSGFILAHVYGNRGQLRTADFYVARFARIVPLYWLALLPIALYRLYKRSLDPVEFALSALMLQSWWPGYSQVLNTPAWSLSVELLFYLCFPLLLRSMARIGSTWGLLAIAVGVWILNFCLHVILLQSGAWNSFPLLRDFTVYHPLTHLATFVSGIAGGLIFKRHRDRLQELAVPLISGSVLLFFGAVLLPNRIIEYHHNGLFVPVFLALIWGLGAAPNLLISRIFSWAPLVLLGEASYGIYILQLPVLLLHYPVATRLALHPDAFFWTYYGLLVILAIACFKYIEVPVRARIKIYYTEWAR